MPTLLFASSWNTATGTGDAAVKDGGKWTGGAERAERSVVASTGLDFPTTNVYRCEYNGASYAVNVLLLGEDVAVPVGTTLYRRVYWRYNLPSGPNEGSSNHPIESTDDPILNVVRPLAWDLSNSVDGAPFDARWLTSYDNIGTDEFVKPHRWRVTLEPDTTYRIEWAMTRLADDGDGNGNWKLQSRIYDTSDVLIRDSSDFVCTNFGHGNHTLATSGADVNVWTTAGQRTLSISGTAIGYQGGYAYVGEYLYYGAFAASTTDWCGPYVNGEET